MSSAGDGFGDSFFGISAVVLTLLVIIGLAVFARCLQTSIEDLRLVRRIEDVRRTYVQLVPGLDGPLRDASTVWSEPRFATGMSARGKSQLFLTSAGLVGLVDAFLLGSMAAITLHLLDLAAAVTWSFGVAVGLGFTIAQAAIQHRAFVRGLGPAAVRADNTR